MPDLPWQRMPSAVMVEAIVEHPVLIGRVFIAPAAFHLQVQASVDVL